ncbi:MAG: MASE1 domain-containing protein [Candidatus Eiseniibacteriota bacterium]
MTVSRPLRTAAIIVLVGALYTLSGRLGLELAVVHSSATAVWPASGIALAALLVFGIRAWPGVFLGAYLVNLATAGTVLTSLGIATGNTLEGLVGAYLVRRYAHGVDTFDQPTDVFRYSIFAGILATALAATVGTTTLVLGGLAPSSNAGAIWLTWWLGDAAGVLVLAPLLILLARKPRLGWTSAEGLEAAGLFLTLLVSGAFVFWGFSPFERKDYPLHFLLVPILLWAVFRFGQRVATTAMVLHSVMAIVGTLNGLGPFARGSTNDSLLLLQSYLTVFSVLLLAVTAALRERRRSQKEIHALNAELEERVTQRTEQLREANTALAGEVASRARAQEALELSQARLLEAQQVAGLGSWEWDMEADRVWWSDELYAIYGIVHDSFGASYESFLERVHEEDRVRVHETVMNAARDTAPFELEHRLVRPDGGVRTLYARGHVVCDEKGRPVRMTGTALDITEQKQAEEERSLFLREQEARREAEAANRAKDDFLAMLSHELRTPLNAIVGWTHLLRTGELDRETSGRAVEAIQRNARIQSHLISDILDSSRMSYGQIRLQVGALDLASVIGNAVETVEPEAAAKGVRIEVRCASGLPAMTGDPDRLQQAVWNLLSNAIKFTPQGRTVRVAVSADDITTRITVEDEGPGIDPEFLPYVFERFRQRDASSTRLHRGLGLGLSIARHLVELHGGAIVAANRKGGGGAIFTITLPFTAFGRARDERPADPPATARDGGAAFQDGARDLVRGMHILLVEDDDESRSVMIEWLTRIGCRAAAAESCDGALALLERQRFDLLVSDIELPGGSGYDLIRALRSREESPNRSIPAIALTAYAGIENSQRALSEGYDAHLAKPIAFEDFLDAVREVQRVRAVRP